MSLARVCAFVRVRACVRVCVRVCVPADTHHRCMDDDRRRIIEIQSDRDRKFIGGGVQHRDLIERDR